MAGLPNLVYQDLPAAFEIVTDDFVTNDDGNGVLRFQITSCPTDISGDGLITVSDLFLVIINMGRTGDHCTGDVNVNGRVGIEDLLIVINTFGQFCPNIF